jgi:hypothetical protein
MGPEKVLSEREARVGLEDLLEELTEFTHPS